MKLWKIVKSGIKGSIMVLIGIYASGRGLGVSPADFFINIIYGPLAFFFLAISGLVVFETLQKLEDSSVTNSGILKGLGIFGALYITGCIISIYNMIIAEINFILMFFVTAIGLLWFLLSYFTSNLKKGEYIADLIVGLAFTLGIIYGTLLNDLNNRFEIPPYIYLFFLSALFLQLSREFMKRFNEGENPNYEELKLPLAFQVTAIIFFVLPLITIHHLMPYLYLMLIGLIFIGLAAFLTVKSLRDTKKFNKISLLLRIGILIELIAFTFVNDAPLL